MAIVNIDEAETNLSALILRAEAGEDIVIVRDDEPVVRLTAVTKPKRRLFGVLAGRYKPVPDAFFFDPLPEDELRLWEGDFEDTPR